MDLSTDQVVHTRPRLQTVQDKARKGARESEGEREFAESNFKGAKASSHTILQPCSRRSFGNYSAVPSVRVPLHAWRGAEECVVVIVGLGLAPFVPVASLAYIPQGREERG